MLNLSRLSGVLVLTVAVILGSTAPVSSQNVLDLLLGQNSGVDGEKSNKVGVSINIDLNSIFNKKEQPKQQTTTVQPQPQATPKPKVTPNRATPKRTKVATPKRITVKQSPRPVLPPEWLKDDAAICMINCVQDVDRINFDTVPLDPDSVVVIAKPPSDIKRKDRYFVRVSPETRVDQPLPFDLVPSDVMVLRTLTGTLNGLLLGGSAQRIASMADDPRVLGISQDFEVTLVRSNPVYQHVTNIPNATKQNLRLEHRDIRVYVVDSGIRETHIDLTQRVANWIGVAAPLGGAYEHLCNSHGTMMAALIAGQQLGISDRAQLIDVNVMPCDARGKGQIYASDILTALDAIELDQIRLGLRQEPFVINMSLATHAEWVQSKDSAVFTETAMVQAVQEFIEKTDAIIVAAAGNDAQDACLYFPAMIPNVITVGAIDQNEKMAAFSNHGRCVDTFALGVEVPTAGSQLDTKLLASSGTSHAAAVVSGIAAHRLAAGDTRKEILRDLRPMTHRPSDTYLRTVLSPENSATGGTVSAMNIARILPVKSCEVANFGSALNLRSAPTTQSHVLVSLDAGTPFKVIGSDGNWIKVSTFTDRIGWVATTASGNNLVNKLGKDTPCMDEE